MQIARQPTAGRPGQSCGVPRSKASLSAQHLPSSDSHAACTPCTSYLSIQSLPGSIAWQPAPCVRVVSTNAVGSGRGYSSGSSSRSWQRNEGESDRPRQSRPPAGPPRERGDSYQGRDRDTGSSYQSRDRDRESSYQGRDRDRESSYQGREQSSNEEGRKSWGVRRYDDRQRSSSPGGRGGRGSGSGSEGRTGWGQGTGRGRGRGAYSGSGGGTGRGGYDRRPQYEAPIAQIEKDDSDSAYPQEEFHEDDFESEEYQMGSGSSPGSSIRSGLEGSDVVYGVFPVLNALKVQRRELHVLYKFEGIDLAKRKDAGALRQIDAAAAAAGIRIEYVGRHDLNLLSNDRPHQGVVLDCGGLEWQDHDEFPAAEDVMASAGGVPPVWLALDEVTDPQNLGAVMRSAYCLGAAGVLGCARNCAPLSAVVSKSSAGALEVTEMHSAKNLPRTLLDARAKGWAVLGAAADSNAISVQRASVTQPTILVLGSEGAGLRTNVRRACSGLVKVEMGLYSMRAAAAGGGAAVGVDSLNVSVAAGILLHSLLSSARTGTSGL